MAMLVITRWYMSCISYLNPLLLPVKEPNPPKKNPGPGRGRRCACASCASAVPHRWKPGFFSTRTGNLTLNQYGYTHTYLSIYIIHTCMHMCIYIYLYLFVCVLFYHILYVCSRSQSEYLELGFPEGGINMDEQTNLLCPTSHAPKTPLLRLT